MPSERSVRYHQRLTGIETNPWTGERCWDVSLDEENGSKVSATFFVDEEMLDTGEMLLIPISFSLWSKLSFMLVSAIFASIKTSSTGEMPIFRSRPLVGAGHPL